MKKSLLRVVFLIVFGLSLLLVGTGTKAYSAGFVSFGIKLSGGMGYLFNGGGDVEKMRGGYETYAADWPTTSAYTSTFDWKGNSLAFDFRGEFLLKFGKYFGVGFGAGYMFMGSNKGNYALMFDYTDTEWWGYDTYHQDDTFTHAVKVSAIPVFINFYFFAPMGPVSFYGYVGPSLNFGSFTHDTTEVWNDNVDEMFLIWPDRYRYSSTDTYKDTATCTAFGFQGGIGLEFAMGPNFAIALEGYGRYVNFANWKGTYTDDWVWTKENWGGVLSNGNGNISETGTLYNWDYHYSWTSKDINEMSVYETKPSGTNWKNVRNAEINFNAVGALLSLIIHF